MSLLLLHLCDGKKKGFLGKHSMFGLFFNSSNVMCLSVEQNTLILLAKDDRFTELGDCFINGSAVNTKSSKRQV